MMTNNKPMFTVIVPTKDRGDYLYHTLRTCSLQDYDNLEVIVSDDGSTDNSREIIEDAVRKDPRIRYVTPGAGTGMRDNFEFALNQVKPGYVIALGADDGLLPYGISGMLEVLLETGQEMLAWPAPMYFYPKARTETGQLILHKQTGRYIVQSKDFLRRQSENLHYLSDLESPMFYVKGVTSTRLVEKVRSRSLDGRFYSCPTPDGYSGIVLAGEVSSYAFSGDPFTIYGGSPASQGLSYLANDAQAKRRSEAFFQDVSQKPMHRDLANQPYSPLITLMTADYLLTIKDLPGWPGDFPSIDYRELLLKSLDELAHGLYAEGRLARELQILNQIAEYQGLGEFFRKGVKGKRRYKKKQPLEGNGISPNMLLIDSTQYDIRNIFDAAYVAYYTHKFRQKTTPCTIWDMLYNSVAYWARSRSKGDHFPNESEWLRSGSTHVGG